MTSRRSTPHALFLRPLLLAVAAAGLSLLGVPRDSLGQEGGISLDFHGGAGRPIASLEDAGAGPSLTLGSDLVISFSPSLSGYGGYRRAAFECDPELCPDAGPGERLVETAWALGVEAVFARRGTLVGLGRVGALLASVESAGGRAAAEVGVEAGISVQVPLGTGVTALPSLRYRLWTARDYLRRDTEPSDLELRHFSAELGLRFSLPGS